MSDAERRSIALMTEVARDDGDALAAIVELWQRPLLSFVFRYVQNEAEARELVHETFVRLHEKRAAFRPGASFSGWLFTIAANLCRNHVRWRARRATEELDGSGAAAHACARPSPDRALVAGERAEAVRRAIAALPHTLKVTLLLHEYENLSYAEIADVLGCSIKGVEARLGRARRRLREGLAGFFDDRAMKAAEPGGEVGATKLAPTILN